MDLNEKPEITEAVSRMWVVASQYGRGDLIPWEQLEAAAGVDRDDNKWGQRWRKFTRRLLEERNIAMRPVPGVGVELLTDREQIEWCSRNRQRRIAKQVRRARKEVSHADTSSLSDFMQQRKVQILRQFERQQKAAKEGMWWLKKDE